ncbi:MAG: dioxygenase, partial [Proteobacteria bacterium]|nr:dioxygenase [Pseudomonadota bacterium]
MSNITKDTLTDAVLATIANDTDPRFRKIMSALIRHMHGFVKEVDLSQEEWLATIEFLYQTGEKTTRQRNEFI